MQRRESEARRTPSVVPCREIPISDAAEDSGLEVRPFGAHEILGSIIPSSGVTLAWTHAFPGRDVQVRAHPTPGLLIILQGTGELTGQVRRGVEHGDVVMLPRHHEYGFTNIGPDGLHALHVAFGDEVDTDSPQASTLKQVLARNEARAEMILSHPFFLLLRANGLASKRKRAMMRECIRVFSDSYQTFLFTRQATCRDDEYRETFHQHFLEELGHNRLLKVAGDPRAAKDPVLLATSSWFNHQLFVLDNVAKVVLNIVLETAGYHFHILAKPVFVNDESAEYFDIHAEADEQHMKLGIDLLEDQHPDTYRRLHQIVDDGWDMMAAMMTRMVQIVEADAMSA